MATEANAELIRENQKELAGALDQLSPPPAVESSNDHIPLFISLLLDSGFASGEINDISPVLERVLQEVRSTGVLCYSWPHVKVLLDAKLKTAMDFVQALDKSSAPTLGMGWGSPTNKARPDERRTNISELLNTFEGCVELVLLLQRLMLVRGSPPFTLQRLTEVIMEPHKFYKSLNKLINALEKVQRRCIL